MLAAVGVEKLQVVVCSLSQWSCQCRVGRCSTAKIGCCCPLSVTVMVAVSCGRCRITEVAGCCLLPVTVMVSVSCWLL